jgi:hypothetical protein
LADRGGEKFLFVVKQEVRRIRIRVWILREDCLFLFPPTLESFFFLSFCWPSFPGDKSSNPLTYTSWNYKPNRRQLKLSLFYFIHTHSVSRGGGEKVIDFDTVCLSPVMSTST